MLSPPCLNFISSVDLTGYNIIADSGVIGKPPIKIFNITSGDKTLKVVLINNGDLHTPNIHVKDSKKGLTQIQPGGGGMAPFILVPLEDALLSTEIYARK